MTDYSQSDIGNALKAVGIQPGDCIMIHSALHAFGFMKDTDLSDICEIFYREIHNQIGESGTLIAPTFNFAFCKGEAFDLHNTPSANMGIFSEYIRTHPKSLRSRHPMQSISAIGGKADYLCEPDTLSCYESGSAFDRMLELDTKILLLGLSTQWVSFVQYAEEHACVPYRYWKTFTGPYVIHEKEEMKSYKMYVRDLELDPKTVISRVADELDSQGKLRKAKLGRHWITALDSKAYVDVAMKKLKKNPYFLVEKSNT